MKSTFASLMSIGSAAAILLSTGTAYAVRGGTPIGGTNFFMVKDDAGHVGTSSTIQYPRCVLTAGHVENGMGAGRKIYAGGDLTTITDATKRQDVQTALVSPDHTMLWVDFAVYWMKNLQDDPMGGPKRIKLADYNPFAPQKAEAITAGTDVAVGGYGDNRTVGGVDMGWMILRTGTSTTEVYMSGSDQSPAQKGAVVGAVPDDEIACAGDSGSPLWAFGVPAGTYGVMASGGGGLCKDVATNTYSVFDNTNATGGKTNWTRINEMIESTCGKSIEAEKAGAPGKVIGSLTPPHEFAPPNDAHHNFTIDTEAGDYTEFMHADQGMDLVAIPVQCLTRFVNWTDNSDEIDQCPCAGSTSTVCPVIFDEVGFYSSTVSHDVSHCIANFEYTDTSCSSSSSSSSEDSSSTSWSSDSSSSSEDSSSSSDYSSSWSWSSDSSPSSDSSSSEDSSTTSWSWSSDSSSSSDPSASSWSSNSSF